MFKVISSILLAFFFIGVATPVSAAGLDRDRCRAMMKRAAWLNPKLMETKKRPPKKPLNWKEIPKLVTMVFMTGAGVLFVAPTLTHHVYGKIIGEEHIGLGIYLDIKKIESLLTPEELVYLYSAEKTPQGVATLFANYLNGDYFDEGMKFWPLAKDASDYFKGQCDKRGICRHKATVLVGLLNHYGFAARTEGGKLNTDGYAEGHEWGVLVDSNEVVDPTSDSMRITGYILPRDEYLERTGYTPSNRLKSVIIEGLGGGSFRYQTIA